MTISDLVSAAIQKPVARAARAAQVEGLAPAPARGEGAAAGHPRLTRRLPPAAPDGARSQPAAPGRDRSPRGRRPGAFAPRHDLL
ncbi:hypothetical protein CKO45_20970 [Paracraurococcus ruber]|uniref:Uncharacterized protein n=1 Tax=Paracraurococcus ruber TaxID=77675 RepID=A0ABS1D356_9PROT|nr:hypothetical protein [Paracraurococcus ruber]